MSARRSPERPPCTDPFHAARSNPEPCEPAQIGEASCISGFDRRAISAYGGIRWGTGRSRAVQYEKTQSRIGPPPWDQPLLYLENSPLFWIDNIHTRYLTTANDQDDAVPRYQGIEFFTAMRHLGKEAYMFVYNGEKHG